MKIIMPFMYGPLSSAPFNRLCGYYRGLKELGAEIILLVFYNEGISLPSNTPEGIIYIKLPYNHNKLVRLYFRYKQIIKSINSYLISGDCIYLYGVPYELLLYYKRKKNIIVVGEITEKLDARTKKPNKVRRFLNNLLDKRIRNLDYLFVISNSLKDYYLSKNIPQNKIEVINMFVDINRMKNVDIIASKKYIACCGSMSSQKDGIDTLIQSFAVFRETHPDYSLKLIGPFINDDDESQLKHLIKDLDLKESVEFTGLVPTNEIPQLLKNARILALTRPKTKQSQYGFPTKLGEYLSTNVPILVTDVGEIRCFLKDLENCRIAEPSNTMDISKKLSWIADHYEESLKLAEKGYELVLSDFSYRTQSAKLYNKILKIKQNKT